MQFLHENRNNCYNFSSVGGQDFVNWSGDNSTEEYLDILAYPYVPVLFYHEYNETNWQWCGPMLRIAEQFAKTVKVKYENMC